MEPRGWIDMQRYLPLWLCRRDTYTCRNNDRLSLHHGDADDITWHPGRRSSAVFMLGHRRRRWLSIKPGTWSTSRVFRDLSDLPHSQFIPQSNPISRIPTNYITARRIWMCEAGRGGNLRENVAGWRVSICDVGRCWSGFSSEFLNNQVTLRINLWERLHYPDYKPMEYMLHHNAIEPYWQYLVRKDQYLSIKVPWLDKQRPWLDVLNVGGWVPKTHEVD